MATIAAPPSRPASRKASRVWWHVHQWVGLKLSLFLTFVLLTVPNAALLTLTFGAAKCGEFVRLKASARNCATNRSVMLKSRNRLRSRFRRPGPSRMLRPDVPKRTSSTGANALVSKNWSGLSGNLSTSIST